MKIKKQYIIIVFVLISIFIIGFSYLDLNKNREVSVIIDDQQTQNKDVLNKQSNTEILIQRSEVKDKIEVIENINTIKVSLFVADKKYETNIKENSSVFEAMEKMQKESASGNIFNFKYTNNASLGNFITEINGEYGTPGKYWIYYVNDKKASVGVSNYILKEGDIIKWSQEGI